MLTELKVKNAKPADKQIKLSDGRGMYLVVMPSGAKYWRFKYRHGGKEKLLALGVYPEITLQEARERRDAARKQLAQGIDPSLAKQSVKMASAGGTGNTFEAVALEWFAKKSPKWAVNHSSKIMGRLKNHLLPYLGNWPIAAVTAPEILKVMRKIEERGTPETAHRSLQIVGQVFRYAIVTGRADRNPAGDLRGALEPVRKQHLAAVTTPDDVAKLMLAIKDYRGSTVTRLALQLAPLLFVRPGELRQAEWSEVDLENAEWNILAAKMKMREPHLVPLSRQAVAILKELKLHTGQGKFLFPCARSRHRPMSNNAVLAALRRMGYTRDEMTGHGFRAMARTILDEVLGVRPDYIEHQLAHAVRDPLGRAYNRTKHLPERREMMQRWADYLDELTARESQSNRQPQNVSGCDASVATKPDLQPILSTNLRNK